MPAEPAGHDARTRQSDAGALVAVVAVLIVTGLLLVNQNMWVTVPIAVVASGLLLWIASRAGLSWHEIGLSRSTIGRGLIWAGGATVAVALGYAVVLNLPFSQDALTDESMPQTAGGAAIKIVLVILPRTVVLEELAFRGVLWALLRRRGSARSATCWSAAAFGLWHVPAGVRLADSNAALADAVGSSGLAVAAVVLVIVLATTLAGLVLAELRRRSASLLAPAGLHWATNGIGTVMSSIR